MNHLLAYVIFIYTFKKTIAKDQDGLFFKDRGSSLPVQMGREAQGWVLWTARPAGTITSLWSTPCIDISDLWTCPPAIPATSLAACDGRPGWEETAQQRRAASLRDTLPSSNAQSSTGQTSARRSGKMKIWDQPLWEQHLPLASSYPSLGAGDPSPSAQWGRESSHYRWKIDGSSPRAFHQAIFLTRSLHF